MTPCEIVSVGKRRDGGTKYWCLTHKADATAKYGVAAESCRYSHIQPPSKAETLELICDEYPGGVALWGAVPPVYDTTCLPIDRGIHVHARKVVGGDKIIDSTFRSVIIKKDHANTNNTTVGELDAIYFMVSAVLDREMSVVICTKCGYSHLDKDWFSVHSHQKHLCSGCGRNFSDTKAGIGNPLIAVKDYFEQGKPRALVPPSRSLEIFQSDYPGGIQIWGSNPAIVWTSEKSEEYGIHVHAFDTADANHYAIDNTYDSVTIDNVHIHPDHVRTLMAQNALPHIAGRVQALKCPFCGQYHFDRGELAYTPHDKHLCEFCDKEFSPKSRLRRTIGNPLLAVISKLESISGKKAQQHDIGLLPETI